MSWYSKNQLSVTQGSAVVTGDGTDFVTFVVAGFGIFIDKVPYEIASVDSTTQLTLTENYQGATRTDTPYSVWPTQGLNYQVWANTTTLIEEFGPLRNNLTLLNQQITDTAGYRDTASAQALAAEQSAADSANWATQSKNSASSSSDSAGKSAASAAAAKTSETNAKTSETNSKTSETNANASKQAAASSAADSLTNKNATADLRSDAQSARDGAVAAQAATETARDAAVTAQGSAESAVSSIQGFRDGAQAAQAAAEAARDTANDSKNAAAASATGAATSETNAAKDAADAKTASNDSATARDASKAAQTASEGARDTTFGYRDAAAQSAEDAANARDAAQTAAAQAQEPVNAGAIEDALGGTPALLEGATFTGTVTVPAGLTIAAQDSDTEGGQINFQKAPNQAITGAIVIDTQGNYLRMFDDGKTSTMLTLDLVNGVLQVAGSTVYTAANLSKASIGLGNVDNTSDVNKPVSTAQQNALNTKAALVGATFTGRVATSYASPGFVLNNTATSGDSTIGFQRSGVTRWVIGDSTGNSILYVNRSDSTGAYQDTPLQIRQADGFVITNNQTITGTLNGYAIGSSGGTVKTGWTRIATINPDGGLEGGYYIDFHADAAGSKDYDARLSADSSGWLYTSGHFQANGGTVKGSGPNGAVTAYSTTSGVTGRLTAQTDGNIVFYRTESSGSDRPIWSISSATGDFNFNNQVKSTYYRSTGGGPIGNYEMTGGSGSTWYNAGLRNDGSTFYILNSAAQSTQAAASTASWNNNRPLSIDLASGNVVLGAGTTSVSGTMNANGILNANSYLNVAAQANFAAPIYANANNGGRQAIRCGDDAWLGDANIGHTISVTSTSDANQGKLCFGQSTQTLGMTGNDNYLRWTGDFLAGSWFRQANNGAGLYWEGLGRGIAAADQGASYGTITAYGSGMNGWQGYAINNNLILMDNANDMRGIYSPNHGGWLVSWDNSANATFAQNITAYSDRRIKKDIAPLTVDVWDKFRKLRPVSYVRKDSGDKRLGLIAQEVEEQFPDLVVTKDDIVQTKSVSYGDLAGGPTVAVVQMLMDKVEQQQTQLGAQAAQIAALMARMDQMESKA